MHPVRFRPHSYKSNNNDYKLSLSLFTFFLGITITSTAEGVTKKKQNIGSGSVIFYLLSKIFIFVIGAVSNVSCLSTIVSGYCGGKLKTKFIISP